MFNFCETQYSYSQENNGKIKKNTYRIRLHFA